MVATTIWFDLQVILPRDQGQSRLTLQVLPTLAIPKNKPRTLRPELLFTQDPAKQSVEDELLSYIYYVCIY